MKKWTQRLPVFLLLVLFLGTSTGLAAPAWVSVPSAAGGSDVVLISGGGLPPFSNITVQVKLPSGKSTQLFATTAADGTFSADYMPVVPGKYAVKVLNQKGEKVGGGDFVHGQ